MTNPNSLIFDRQHLVAAVVAAVVSLFLSWGLSEAACLMKDGCIEDDASRRATALLGPIITLAYVLLTVILFLGAVLSLAERLPAWLAGLMPPLVLSSLLSWALYSPTVDSAEGIAQLFFWLLLPWFAGNYSGLVFLRRQKSRGGSKP